MQGFRAAKMTGTSLNYRVVLHGVALCVGMVFLVVGCAYARTIPLLIGNVALLISGFLRKSAIEASTADASIRRFQRGLYFLSPRLSEIDAAGLPAKPSEWSIKTLRNLGLLYCLDRAAMVLLLLATLWLSLLAVVGASLVHTALVVAIGGLWGGRLAFRILWLFLRMREAGNGSFLATLRQLDEEAPVEPAAESSDVADRFNLIVRLQSEGRTENALEEANRLVAAASELPGAYCMRGTLLSAAERYGDAIEDFSRAIQLDNRYAQAFRCRGVAWSRLANLDKAREDLSQAIELSGGADAAPFIALGDVYIAAKDYDRALAAFSQAAAVDAAASDAYLGAARSLIELKRFGEAIETCAGAINLGSQDELAYALRAWGQMLIGEYSNALADFKRAIELSGPQSGNLAHYGYAWLLATCPDDAVRDSDLAVSSARRVQERGRLQQWQIEKLWGAVHASQYQFDAAVEHQRKAIDMAPVWAAKGLENNLRKYLAREPIRSVNEDSRPCVPEFTPPTP